MSVDIAEQPGSHPAFIHLADPREIDRRQQGLRIAPDRPGCLLEPNRRRRPAGGNPGSLQIGFAEIELRFGIAAIGGLGQA